jgi:hypothetical protein
MLTSYTDGWLKLILSSSAESRAELNWLPTASLQLQLSILDWLPIQSHFTTGGLPPISSSWCQAPWESRSEFFQLNPCSHSPYVTSCLTGGWDCLLWIGLAFVKCMYRTYSMLLRIIPFSLCTSPLAGRPVKLLLALASTVIPVFSLLEIHGSMTKIFILS